MEVQLKMQESTSDNSGDHESGARPVRGEARGLRGLHLAETGVYKNSLNLLRNHLIFPKVGGELA